MPKLTAKPEPTLKPTISEASATLKPIPSLEDVQAANATLAADNARLATRIGGYMAESAAASVILGRALDLDVGLSADKRPISGEGVGIAALAKSAEETIAALRLEADSRPILPETARDEWKAELVARIDAMDAPGWKVSALTSILAHSEPVDPAAVTAALARLVGASGKVAVKNGLGVVSAIHAAGHRVVRQIDGDLIVAVR
jgi:hypothetical protein